MSTGRKKRRRSRRGRRRRRRRKRRKGGGGGSHGIVCHVGKGTLFLDMDKSELISLSILHQEQVALTSTHTHKYTHTSPTLSAVI